MSIYKEEIRLPLAYVYKITNKITHEFYIGSRTNKSTIHKYTPEQDFGFRYFSSGPWRNDIKLNPHKYNVDIIFRSNETITTRDNHEEFIAYWYEQLTIRSEIKINNKLCINGNYICPDNLSKAYHSRKGKAKGMFSVSNSDGVHIWTNKHDPKFISKEYIALSAGRTTVKDQSGSYLSVSVNDERLKSGELYGLNKGTTVVKSSIKSSKYFRVDVNDPRILSGELVPYNIGHKYKIKKCPHCNAEGAGPNMSRYHFDNCSTLTGISLITRNQFSK